MIDPQGCVDRILCNDPEVADSLYLLVLWVRNAKGALNEAKLDDVKSFIYSKTTDSAKHQLAFDRHQLNDSVIEKVDFVAMAEN